MTITTFCDSVISYQPI